eukprot:2560887-Prymnesium_polylepis.1
MYGTPKSRARGAACSPRTRHRSPAAAERERRRRRRRSRRGCLLTVAGETLSYILGLATGFARTP